jgi:hypothetical protein
VSKVTGIALGRNADGRLDLLATSAGEGPQPTVWHAWQTTHGGDWTEWRPFGKPGGGTPYPAPAVITHAVDGRLEVFITAGDGTVWHRWQTVPNRGWSPWDSLGKPGEQPATTTPVLALLPDSRVVAVVVAGGTVWQASQQQPGASPDWSAWSSLGRPGNGMADAVAIENNTDGRQELFAREVRNEIAQGLWHRWRTAPGADDWSDWSPLGIPGERFAPGVPVVDRSVDGRLFLFTVADETVWHRSQQSANGSESWMPWTSWPRRAGGFAHVGVAVDAIGRLVLVATSRSGTDLWATALSEPGASDWTEWSPLGSVAPGPAEDPTLGLSTSDGRMELFLRTPSTGGLYQLSATGPGRWWPFVGRQWSQP